MRHSPRATRKPKGCILRALGYYGLFVLSVGAVWLAGGHTVAWWSLRGEWRAWAETGTSMDALRVQYPNTPNSDEARDLDLLAQRMGIRLIHDPDHPTALDEELHDTCRKYVQTLANAADDNAGPLPPAVQKHLDSHRSDLTRIALHLIETDGISWATDIDAGPEAPIPSLLGHRSLHTLLLIEGLQSASQGNIERARLMLEASWRDGETLAGRPDLISQLIVAALAQNRNTALRLLPVSLPAWHGGQSARRSRAAMARSLQLEAYAFFVLTRAYRGVMDCDGPVPESPFAGGVFLSVTRVLTVPYVRLGVVSLSRYLRKGRALVLSGDPCAVLATAEQQLDAAVPRSNLVAKIAAPSIPTLWRIAVTADLDNELTRLILAARKSERRHGEWADTRSVPSQVCEGVVWLHSPEPDGRLTILPAPPGVLNGLTSEEQQPSRRWTHRLSPAGPRH